MGFGRKGSNQGPANSTEANDWILNEANTTKPGVYQPGQTDASSKPVPVPLEQEGGKGSTLGKIVKKGLRKIGSTAGKAIGTSIGGPVGGYIGSKMGSVAANQTYKGANAAAGLIKGALKKKKRGPKQRSGHKAMLNMIKEHKEKIEAKKAAKKGSGMNHKHCGCR